jgi:sugar phosphate isomerase/epimerase
MRDRLALHTWTLDTTPLAEVLRVAGRAGWNAIELRRLDFARAAEGGQPAEAVIDRVQASGVPVSCVGGERGWMFAGDADRRRLMAGWRESCRWARVLGAPLVMSPADAGLGDRRQAGQRVREVGDIAADAGVRVAIEAGSQSAQLSTLATIREVLAIADHPCCGLLVDAYHLERSGEGLPGLLDLAAAEIVYVQYSDVPRTGLEPGQVLDRLPPGQGCVPFREFFRLLADKRYEGYLSYEAPNPAAWARDPGAVASEAAVATRALLPD